ncbi:DUF4011 domain-containing protein [Zhihengliuella halotolerans]|uniref:AAA domain-containing protein n=1 Tax=Zhihengliuella halotolerans TaxID=370736 RepID=A0A4Q8A9Y4_9MICC|nr:DUF4011 domain-containing protein [Zhihengliuella halotolerans]RZU60897.1 hypothetical protein EV380_0448 [Zhihengliuella halotolerans]
MGTEESGSAIADWLDELGPGAGTDTLLRFAGSPSNSIDVTHAHPSGLAQFMAGRRTRLSMLLRDQEAFLPGLRTARALRGKIQELADERGIDVGYLAAGVVSWRSVVDSRSEQFSAPVMLVRISLAARDRDDYDVQISGRAQVNPALVRYFAEHHDVDIDLDALYGAAYMTARFDPRQAMDELRRQLAGMPSTVVEHRLLVSTFADVADPADPDHIDPEHPVLARLLAARGNVDGPAPAVVEPDIEVLSSDDRDPADELLVLDADASQQEVLDLLEAGESVAVSAPPGTGQTQTAVNAAALLAGQGKRILVVAERRETAAEFADRLEQLGLGGLALRIVPEIDAETLRRQLTRAILRNERATEPKLEKLHETLKRHRHALLDHVRSLHNVRERWGCSPYQAMQELARLTSLLPAPSTAVRLKRSVLDSIVTRHETSAKLRRAAEIGAFTQKAVDSPWYGARLRNTREADEAFELAERLDEELAPLREKMQKLAEYSQVKLGATVATWGEQLELVVAVRESLDKFESDIFDRSVDDLIAATASSAWRKERGIELGSVTRSRLRRVAKEYIRPGVHIADLHTSLQEVQQQREAWKSYATSQRHPTVPNGLHEIHRQYTATRKRLQDLDRVMGTGRREKSLADRDVADVVAHVKRLVADREELTTLPERTLLIEQLTESGLAELMDDLRGREVPADQVGHELELAWWQSVLEAMISGDDYLAMSDGNQLRQLEAEYRLADNAHIASGASRLKWELAQRWKAALGDHRAGSRELKALLKDGQPSVEALAGFGAPLVNSLVPVWVGSPLMIPSVVPAETKFDAVMLLDADALSLRSALGAISRAPQIVAFGDDALGGPKSFSVSVDPTASLRAPKQPVGTFTALSEVLPKRRLTTVYRGVDENLTEILGAAYYDSELSRLPVARALGPNKPALCVEYVHDGTGLPDAGAEAVESTVGEVRLVADLVFSHIRRRPQMSLAVVASNQRHAARIAEAIQVQLPNYPWAREFFAREDERFQVSTIERSKSIVRDAVILALGYGRTPHGKAVHDFGALSGPEGDQLVASALTRSREFLTIVTAVRPEDLDLERVKGGASRLMDVIEHALAPEAGSDDDGAPLEDPLVADLRNRLLERGATVRQRYRGELDLAIQAPAAGDEESARMMPLAVVSDGTDAYSRLTVRQRSRLRPQLLESLGWRYVPLWTIDVFSDPGRIADALSEYLNLSGSNEDDVTTADSGAQKPSGRRAQKPTLFTDPVLPQTAGEDDPRSWGESGEDRDDWLKEQRPPHWG